jgi:hypothetical protein
VILMMLLLAWLVASVPASLLLARAMAGGNHLRTASPRPIADWRREPAAA